MVYENPEGIYCTEGMELNQKKRILSDLLKGNRVEGIYCICACQHQDHILEIVDAKEFMKNSKHYRLVGLAESYDQAAEVLKKIIFEVFLRTGKIDKFH